MASIRSSLLAGVLAVVPVGALLACSPASSSSGAVTQPAVAAPPPCPLSYELAATASCSDGQICPYLAACEPIAGNATCVCSGGHFACTGVPGVDLDAAAGDASPACPLLATTEVCPTTEASARGLFCSEPGLICHYPSACTSIPAYDSCQCVAGRTVDEGVHFECTPACEALPDAGYRDANTPDANAPEVSTGDGATTDATAPSIDGASE